MLFEAIILLVAVCALILADAAGHSNLLMQALPLLLMIPAAPLIVQMAPPFVPTSPKVLQSMLRLARINKGDQLYDLGCGDGRLLIAAAQKGAIATGYELSLPVFLLATIRTRRYPSISVRYGNFWKKNYCDADVLLCYLLPAKMVQFEKDIWPTLKPGCRVVSHAFAMPTVKPDATDGRAMVYVKQ
jgi:hypothetical protein